MLIKLEHIQQLFSKETVTTVKEGACALWNGMQTFRVEKVRPFLTQVSNGVYNAHHFVAQKLAGSEELDLMTRTVTTVNGVDVPVHVVGAGAALGGLAACPVAGAVYKGCKRFLKGKFQIRTNNQVLAEVSNLPKHESQKKIELLNNRAQVLEDRAIAQKEVASSYIGKWGLFKYVATFAFPVCATPQVAKIAAVVTTVCPPLVLKGIVASVAVGAALCAIRFVSARYDAYREKCQAATTMKQAKELRTQALAIERGTKMVEEATEKANGEIAALKAEKEGTQAQIAQMQAEHANAINQLTAQIQELREMNQQLMQRLVALVPQPVQADNQAAAVNQPVDENADNQQANVQDIANDQQAEAQPNNNDDQADNANDHAVDQAPAQVANQDNQQQVVANVPVAQQPAANHQVAANNGNRRYWFSPFRVTDWMFGY